MKKDYHKMLNRNCMTIIDKAQAAFSIELKREAVIREESDECRSLKPLLSVISKSKPLT